MGAAGLETAAAAAEVVLLFGFLLWHSTAVTSTSHVTTISFPRRPLGYEMMKQE